MVVLSWSSLLYPSSFRKFKYEERCPSGWRCSSRKAMFLTEPWVRIPLSPPMPVVVLLQPAFIIILYININSFKHRICRKYLGIVFFEIHFFLKNLEMCSLSSLEVNNSLFHPRKHTQDIPYYMIFWISSDTFLLKSEVFCKKTVNTLFVFARG